MSYNSWLFVYANPIMYVDHSGLCIDENQDGECDVTLPPPGPSGNSILAFFTRVDNDKVPEWQPKEMEVIDRALWIIAHAYSREYNKRAIHYLLARCPRTNLTVAPQKIGARDAFVTLHGGKIEFNRTSKTCIDAETDEECWAQVHNSRKIFIFRNASWDEVSDTRFITHEVGHAFEAALEGTLGEKLGRNTLDNTKYTDLWTREGTDDDPYAGFYGPNSQWQWSKEEGREKLGEIFADQFVGWVYGRFSDTSLGRQRAHFMGNFMPDWITKAILVRRGLWP